MVSSFRLSLSRISIHAPREGSDSHRSSRFLRRPISIHAPREGSDYSNMGIGYDLPISIHAPREGSDPLETVGTRDEGHFNPRSP